MFDDVLICTKYRKPVYIFLLNFAFHVIVVIIIIIIIVVMMALQPIRWALVGFSVS
jgi:hypothetical protein